ncbi:hypothetical protein BpHYR1_037689 [Brachionus plicatilis]|uniref:Uncharacterized protein n=1 Tax=Brachionus plicatilis TaxID=10195 RepID=A0A3M7QMB2_BRAPC|nr:hypothetical protein BpHYR1_037689 [Brachionus plicatilis]
MKSKYDFLSDSSGKKKKLLVTIINKLLEEFYLNNFFKQSHNNQKAILFILKNFLKIFSEKNTLFCEYYLKKYNEI